MTITAETIDRLNLIATARPVTETPIESMNVETDDAIDYSIPLYVTRVGEASEHRAEKFVGKVVKVRRRSAREDSWWAWDEDDLLNITVHGARLNPEMQNGHYYRSLDATGLLVRYNDDEHESARNLPLLPLSIIAANGSTWPVPGDGTVWAANVQYIEVEKPEGEADPEPMDVHQSNAADGPTWGHAVVGEDECVVVNPDLEAGKLYLVWAERVIPWDAASRITLVGYLGKPEEAEVHDRFVFVGAYSTSPAGVVNFVNDTSIQFAHSDRELLKWAELALTTPEPDSERTANALYSTMTTESGAFTALNEAMNELADEHDWCSDYESIIEPLGMEGRVQEKDWLVEVDVTFTFDDENPSGEFDERAATRHAVDGLTITNASYSATARISIYVDDTSEQGARDYIDSSEIEERLQNMMSHASSVDVSNWDIYSVEER